MSDHGHESHGHESHGGGHGGGHGGAEFKGSYFLGLPLFWEFIQGTIGKPSEVEKIVNIGAGMSTDFSWKVVQGSTKPISEGFTVLGSHGVHASHGGGHDGGGHGGGH